MFYRFFKSILNLTHLYQKFAYFILIVIFVVILGCILNQQVARPFFSSVVCLIFCLFLFTSNLFTSHTLSTKAILISNITMHISRGMVLLLVLKAHFFNPSLQISCAFSAESLGLQRFNIMFQIFISCLRFGISYIHYHSMARFNLN